MTATTENAAQVGSAAWLLACADRLDSEGQHELAAEARAEAAVADIPRPATQPVQIRCDMCQRKVSERQAAKYDALGVDWALCPTCEVH